MKKAVLFFLILSLFFLFTACNDYKEHSYSISAADIISGEKLTIKMHVRRVLVGSPTEHFSVKMDLKELSDAIIKSDSSVTTEIYQNEYIVVRTESNFFLLQEREQEKDAYHRYTFFAPVACFDTVTPQGVATMYVPYHLINGVTVQYVHGTPGQYPQTLECEACGTIEEFIEFYRALKFCDVEIGENRIVVTNTGEGYYGNGHRMELSFYQDGKQPKVTFTILDKSV